MAPPPGKTKDEVTALRARRLARMKLFATGLLVLMAALYVAARMGREAWPGLEYLQAFAEAAMVGACADWFAVVALFRRPFGLPIPHTAIIARNKDRIGESLGAFICNNFLAPEVVAARLDGLDVAGRLGRWLAEPRIAALLARRAEAFLPALLDSLDDTHVRQWVRNAAAKGLDSVEAGPLAARILAALVARGHHQALFDKGLWAAEDFLLRNEGMIRAKVADRSWRWLPRWVDQKLADKVIVGLLETITELRAPNHPWRSEFQNFVEDFIRRLSADPVLGARAEALKGDILANPVIAEYLDSLWGGLRARLAEPGQGMLRGGLERAIAGLGARLVSDPGLRSDVNRWLARMVDRNVVPHRGDIGEFIAGVMRRWDTRTLVDKLELQVGRDLQFIRINGTIVGGLVGLGIHALSKWLG